MSSIEGMWSLCGGFALTYLIHSTCLLSICWLITSVVNHQCYAFHSYSWKCAALLGVATSASALMSKSALNSPPGWSLVADSQPIQPSADTPADRAEFTPRIKENDSISFSSEAKQSQISATTSSGETAPISRITPGPEREHLQTGGIADSPVHSLSPGYSTTTPLPPFLLSIAAGIALLSFVLGMMRFLLRWKSYHWMMQSCQPSSRRVNRMMQRVQQHCPRGRDLQVLVSALAQQPFAAGVFRWKIVLPSGLEAKLGNEELYALLAHESGHLQRGDLKWQWIGELVCSCLAIQPLNFVARRQWQRASEFLADRWSVAHCCASPLALAKCLTRVAEWMAEKGKVVPLSSGFAAHHEKQLVARVNELLSVTRAISPRRSDEWSARITAAVTWAGICSLTWFAPHCLPNHAMAAGDDANRIASQLSIQWNEAELDVQRLRAELEQLVDVLRTQDQSPTVRQIVADLELRTNSMTKRASVISRKFHNKETQ